MGPKEAQATGFSRYNSGEQNTQVELKQVRELKQLRCNDFSRTSGTRHMIIWVSEKIPTFCSQHCALGTSIVLTQLQNLL